MSETDEAAARIAALETMCDRLAASVVLLAHEAHPVYGSTTTWRGGIGGQAMTQGCSIIDPPPGADWTQFDLPTSVARDWLRERDVDLTGLMAALKAEWTAMLRPPTTPSQTQQEAM